MSNRLDAAWPWKRKETLRAGHLDLAMCWHYRWRIRAGAVDDLAGWGSLAYTRHDVMNSW